MYACLSAVFLFCATSLLQAQNVDQYKRQRELLNAHLKSLDQNLNNIRMDRAELGLEVDRIEALIAMRRQLQAQVDQEISFLDSSIFQAEEALGHLSENIKKDQDRLDSFVRKTYYLRLSRARESNPGQSGSDPLTVEQLRFEQMKRSLQSQLRADQEYSNMLSDTLTMLEEIKEGKSTMLHEEYQKILALQEEENKSEEQLNKIKKKEELVSGEIERQKKERLRLSLLIGDIIKEENRVTVSSLSSLDDTSLSSAFESNKGRLNWPVQNGEVTAGFGPKRHPTLQDVVTDNFGIDMICHSKSKIQSIYRGRVLVVTYQQPYQYIVIVNHGSYNSAYYYLDEVVVSKGATVEAAETLGFLGDNDSNASFHFEIWAGQKQVDPEQWLDKQDK